MNAIKEAEANLRESARVFRKWADSLDRPIPNMTRIEQATIDEQTSALRSMAARHEDTAAKLAELVTAHQV